MVFYKVIWDPEESIKEFLNYLSDTKNELLVVGGELGHSKYGRDDVLDALDEAWKRGVKSIFMFGPDFDVESAKLAKRMRAGQFYVYRRDIRAPYHFKVFDGNKLFIEESHDQMRSGPRKGVFYPWTMTLGSERRREFYRELSAEATRIPPNKIELGTFNLVYYNVKENEVLPATRSHEQAWTETVGARNV